MKVSNRDNCKYSINLKIFKLQPTVSTNIVNSDKKSSLIVPMPTTIMPTVQRKRNSWRNAWKLAHQNNTQSIKNQRNHQHKNSQSISRTSSKDKICSEPQQSTAQIKDNLNTLQIENNHKDQVQLNKEKTENLENHIKQTDIERPLAEEEILCKFIHIKFIEIGCFV